MAKKKQTGIYKRPGSPYWWINYTDPISGDQVRISSKTTVKELAEQLRAQKYSGAYRREHFGESVVMSGRQLIDWAWENHWSRKPHANLNALMQRLKYSLAEFGVRDMASLPVDTIQKYITKRLLTVEKATINRELADWRSAVNLAIKSDGMLKRNPFMGIGNFDETDNRRHRIATDAERVALIDGRGNWSPFCHIEPSKVMRDVIEFDFSSGLRQGEIRKLRWADVDMLKGTMRVTSRKGRKAKEMVRYVPIFAGALAVLQRRPGAGEFVFSGREGGQIPENGLIGNFKRLTDRLKIDNFHFHDIRHTFATEYYRRTKNIAAISYILGHTSIETTMIYLNLKHEDLIPQQNFDIYHKISTLEIVQSGKTSKEIEYQSSAVSSVG